MKTDELQNQEIINSLLYFLLKEKESDFSSMYMNFTARNYNSRKCVYYIVIFDILINFEIIFVGCLGKKLGPRILGRRPESSVIS